jgi:hypothetical protein
MDGWSFPRGQEVMDDDDSDVLMADDLDTSPQNLSDDLLVGGASYGDLRLQEDGELSDISELLVMSPQPRPATSVSIDFYCREKVIILSNYCRVGRGDQLVSKLPVLTIILPV